jgi:hypothetical protein
MDSLSFFLGSGKLRYWYVTFYVLGLPVYIIGIFLLGKVQATPNLQTREFVLNIFTFGYLLLAVFSLINTLLYIHNTKKFFWGFFIFFGIQIVFWLIGNALGNNYIALIFLFSFFLCITLYVNLKALSYVYKSADPKHHKKE